MEPAASTAVPFAGVAGDGVMASFTWNMHQFEFSSKRGKLKLGAVEEEMTVSKSSLIVLTEVCGTLA